jgi:AcrR family transcriptional regulator
MEVFARYGYRRAAMDQIAREAGLTRQAVYHHFKSKEAVFRAAVETLHEGAFAAESDAADEGAAAGRDLADILAAKVGARFRYIVDCLATTPHTDELLSERQLQARDLNQSFADRGIDLHVATIERFCRAQGLRLRRGFSARALARCIEVAIRGFTDLRLDARALNDLEQIVRLIANGAIEHKPAADATSGRRAKNKDRQAGRATRAA